MTTGTECYDPAASSSTSIPLLIMVMDGDVNPTILAGTAAGQGTFYRQADGALWYKNGPGNFDWAIVVEAPVPIP